MPNHIHTVQGDWMIFEDDETKEFSICHFCTGVKKDTEDLKNVFNIDKLAGFHYTEKWSEEQPECEACKEKVPKSLAAAVLLSNLNI